MHEGATDVNGLKQTSITFVENILHSGKSNGRTTAAARHVPENRMRAFLQLFNTVLFQVV